MWNTNIINFKVLLTQVVIESNALLNIIKCSLPSLRGQYCLPQLNITSLSNSEIPTYIPIYIFFFLQETPKLQNFFYPPRPHDKKQAIETHLEA